MITVLSAKQMPGPRAKDARGPQRLGGENGQSRVLPPVRALAGWAARGTAARSILRARAACLPAGRLSRRVGWRASPGAHGDAPAPRPGWPGGLSFIFTARCELAREPAFSWQKSCK